MESHRRVPKLQTWEHLVLGGFSGACAATVTMPLDNVKTIIQCSRSQPITQVLKQTMQDQGVMGLFAGLVSAAKQYQFVVAVRASEGGTKEGEGTRSRCFP